MKGVGRLPANAAVAAIRLYQVSLSPLLGNGCRFYPTCSEYAVAAIERDGLGRGALRAARRLARCTPFGGGGLDLP